MNTFRTTSFRSVAVLAGLAMLATGCRGSSVTISDEGVVNVARPDVMPVPPGPPGADEPGIQPDENGAQPVVAHPEAQNSRAVFWDSVSFDRGEQRLDIFWTSGVEPCTVLDRIDVAFEDDDVVVTLFEGIPPEAATISCIEIAQYKTTSITLDEDPGERRFIDGAA